MRFFQPFERCPPPCFFISPIFPFCFAVIKDQSQEKRGKEHLQYSEMASLAASRLRPIAFIRGVIPLPPRRPITSAPLSRRNFKAGTSPEIIVAISGVKPSFLSKVSIFALCSIKSFMQGIFPFKLATTKGVYPDLLAVTSRLMGLRRSLREGELKRIQVTEVPTVLSTWYWADKMHSGLV